MEVEVVRKLSEAELLMLSDMLKMESEGLITARATNMLIEDSDLKKSEEAGMMTAEARIEGMRQFIMENHVLGTGEVQ